MNQQKLTQRRRSTFQILLPVLFILLLATAALGQTSVKDQVEPNDDSQAQVQRKT
jgi:hypothetical protein